MRIFRNINIRETEAFQYIQVPMVLVRDPYFGNKSPFGKPLSGDAKILYGLFLNRTGLSKKYDWTTENGDVYIIFRTKEIEEVMCCANQKAGKMLKELETYGLIERKRRGQGKPDIIFVKAFYDSDFEDDNKGEIQRCENHISKDVKTTSLEVCKSHPIYKDKYNTKLDSYFSKGGKDDGYKKIKEQIGFTRLIDEFPKEEVESALASVVFVNTTDEEILKIGDINLKLCEIRESFKDLSYDVVKTVLKNALSKSGYKHRNYYILALFNQCRAEKVRRPKRDGPNNFPSRNHTNEYWEELERVMYGT